VQITEVEKGLHRWWSYEVICKNQYSRVVHYAMDNIFSPILSIFFHFFLGWGVLRKHPISDCERYVFFSNFMDHDPKNLVVTLAENQTSMGQFCYNLRVFQQYGHGSNIKAPLKK